MAWLINILLLAEKIKKYRISPSNTYNFDEMISSRHLSYDEAHCPSPPASYKNITPFKSGWNLSVSVLTERHISQALFIKAKSYGLQDSWPEDLIHHLKKHILLCPKGDGLMKSLKFHGYPRFLILIRKKKPVIRSVSFLLIDTQVMSIFNSSIIATEME
jgi:hypothetical protein